MARKQTIKTPPPQKDAPPPPGSVRLFKKKLDSRDANPVLGQLVIEECWDEMKTALEKVVAEKRDYCLRVMVEDPLSKTHELHFMKYFGGRYALFHKWGNVVSRNNLREGNTVECWGYFDGNDEIQATLVVNPSERNSSPENPREMEIEPPEQVRLKSLQFKHLLKIPEAVVETPAAVDFLFEKKLDYADVDPDLDHLVFTRCGKRLKTALDETPSLRVFMVDPNNNVKHTSLLFKRYIIGEMYALDRKWAQFVAENDLKEGDTVVGYGNDVGGGGGREFTLQLYVLRDEDEPPTSDAATPPPPPPPEEPDEGLKMEEDPKKETRRKKKKNKAPLQQDAATPQQEEEEEPVWLFKKKLSPSDIATVGDQCQLVIKEYGDELKTVLDKMVEEYLFLRIIAEDTMGFEYNLHFTYNTPGTYAVFNHWGNVVTFNELREGDTVECWGNYAGKDEFHATLRVEREMPAVVNQPPENPEEKEQEILEQLTDAEKMVNEVRLISDQEAEGQIPVEKQTKEREILFEKKLDYDDVEPGLDRLVFKHCSDKLKAALEITPNVKVCIVGRNNKVECTPMLFMRYVVEDLYTLCHGWRRFVARHALKVGDMVTGYGNEVGGREISVKFSVRRDQPPPSNAKTEEDARRQTLLLLGKDPKTVLGRVVINSTSTEVAEVVEAREGTKMEGYNEDEDEGGVFARISAEGANGVKYEWSEEVDGDRLSKSVKGAVVGDGEVQMWIDVYKGLRH